MDDEASFDMDDEDEDQGFDFDNLFPPPGNYEVTVLSVAYRDYDNENTGRHVLGLNIRLQLTGEEAGEFAGQFITEFMYLGENQPNPRGRQAMKAFFDAAGIPCEGNMKLSQWKPEWRTIGKTRDKVLSVFDNVRLGANLATEDKTIGGKEVTDLTVKYWLSLDQLEEAQAKANPNDEPF